MPFKCASCNKEYEKKMFHCYEWDFCSSKCMHKKVLPRREEEARKKKEIEEKQNRFQHIGGFGPTCR